MARRMKSSERKVRKIIGATGRAILGAMEAKEAVTSPHSAALKILAKSMAKADKVRTIKGQYRHRRQFLNPKNRRWYVIDTRTNKIVRGGKITPYKNISKSRRRSRRRRNH